MYSALKPFINVFIIIIIIIIIIIMILTFSSECVQWREGKSVIAHGTRDSTVIAWINTLSQKGHASEAISWLLPILQRVVRNKYQLLRFI